MQYTGDIFLKEKKIILEEKKHQENDFLKFLN